MLKVRVDLNLTETKWCMTSLYLNKLNPEKTCSNVINFIYDCFYLTLPQPPNVWLLYKQYNNMYVNNLSRSVTWFHKVLVWPTWNDENIWWDDI